MFKQEVMRKNRKREQKSVREVKIFQKTALAAFLIMIAVIAEVNITFMLGFSMGLHCAIVPLTLLLLYSSFKDTRLFAGCVICIALLSLWAAVCAGFFDVSYDAMYYHKEAIIALKEGWNPVYQSSLEADEFASYANLHLWLDNYPKGIWILSAVIYKVTEVLETAKAVNILFMIGLFALSADVFINVFKMKKTPSLIFSLLMILNPVFIDQLLTSYNDIAVGILVIMSALLGIKIYSDNADMSDYILLFCVVCMSPLVKFTAPVLVGAPLVCFGIEALIKKIKIKRAVISIALAAVIGIFFLGMNPYVVHIIKGQNIVYPILGEGKTEVITDNMPKGMEDKNCIEKLAIANFSKVSNSIQDGYSFKIPFSVSEKELAYLSNSDIRIGGFGVWFGPIFIIAVILALIGRIRGIKLNGGIFVTIISFILLALFFPESWWARYSSYTYYIPLLLILNIYNSTMPKPLTVIVSIMIAANSAITLGCVINEGNRITDYMDMMLRDIKSKNTPVILRVNSFPSHVKLFEEYGIPYTISHKSLDPNKEIVFYDNTKFMWDGIVKN